MYAELLDEINYPSIRAVFPAPEQILLVQDNCPVHKSGVVQEWFEDYPVVLRMFWPARSSTLFQFKMSGNKWFSAEMIVWSGAPKS